MNAAFWRGRSVFVTGHTGFKGSWLALWLQRAGAKVHGYSKVAPTQPNLFEVGRVAGGMSSQTLADVRDSSALEHALIAADPTVVFHLAAQPLVRQSYSDPVETYAVNVLGTVHLLEAVRKCRNVRAVVNITTDKCYENKEWVWGYREHEPLGGHDPYSSSKACSELVTAAYRSSFFQFGAVGVATARAGNVIGGGDWAVDRLIPDFFRSADVSKSVEIRHPDATRPWQHVLEPLSGYLRLAEALVEKGHVFASAWNFGPSDEDARPVAWILDRLSRRIAAPAWRHIGGKHVHETHFLKLDSSRAAAQLGWQPAWNLEQALDKTVDWHLAWRRDADMRDVCMDQIADHCRDATR